MVRINKNDSLSQLVVTLIEPCSVIECLLFFTDFQIGHAGDLPRAVCDDYENDVEFLKKVHHVLVEVRTHYYFVQL